MASISSHTASTVDRAANTINRKNRVPHQRPPFMWLNMLRQTANGQAHDEVGKHTARNAEEHCRHAAGKDAAEHDAHEQDLPRLPPAEQHHGDERDDVGKAELHTRDRHDGRDLRLGDEDRQRDGGEHGQNGQPLRPLHGVPSICTVRWCGTQAIGMAEDVIFPCLTHR